MTASEKSVQVTFNQFQFENNSSLQVRVELQAPIGTTVIPDTAVGPNSPKTFSLNVSDATSARVFVKTDGGIHDIDERIETTASPYANYITRLTSRFLVGSIHGSVATEY